MNTDPIADLLTRLRNAAQAGHKHVELPSSKLKVAMVKLFLEEGYLKSYELKDTPGIPYPILRVVLKYDAEGFPVIRKLRRVSRPGLRKYAKKVNLPRVLNGAGVAVISTSKGLRSDRAARREGLGGEIMCVLE